MENLHNVEACIKTDKVSQSQRAHRHVGSEFHGLVDILFGSDSFIQGIYRLVDVGHEEPVSDKARDVSGGGGFFAHFS